MKNGPKKRFVCVLRCFFLNHAATLAVCPLVLAEVALGMSS